MFGSFRLLYSEICSYLELSEKGSTMKTSFRLLYSEICSYSVGMGMNRDHVDHTVFVSYIRRYVLTGNEFERRIGKLFQFSSPIFGDMFLLSLICWLKIMMERLICFRLLYSEICSYYKRLIIVT